jgi:ABC-2 type transport system permease protein
MTKPRTSFLDIFIRQFRQILHDGGVMLFFIFLPLAYPIIYSLIYNPEVVRDVKMVVVDNDRTPLSRQFTRNMDATQEAEVIGYAADLAEAKRAMDSHQCYAILEIPKGFERKVGRGESSPAILYCEMSLLLRYRGFLVAATKVQTEMGAEIQQATLSDKIPNAASLSTGDLMPISYIQMGNIEGGFDSFIMPGVLIFILHQVLVLAVAMLGAGMRERRELYPFDTAAGSAGVLKMMLAQLLCCLIMMAVPACFLLYYVPLIFRFPMQGDVFQIFAYILPMCIACVFLGQILQGIVRQREDVFVVWVPTSVALLFLSGLTWPRCAMATAWQWVSDIIPATWGMQGFVKMSSNGASLAQVSGEYLNEWVLVAVYAILAFIVQRFSLLKAIRNGKNC